MKVVRSGSKTNPKDGAIIKSLGLKSCVVTDDKDLEEMIKERMYLKTAADRFKIIDSEIKKKLTTYNNKEHLLVGNYYIKRTPVLREEYTVPESKYYTVKYIRVERRRESAQVNSIVSSHRSSPSQASRI